MSEDQQENGTSNGEVPEIELIIKVSIALDCTSILCLKGKILQKYKRRKKYMWYLELFNNFYSLDSSITCFVYLTCLDSDIMIHFKMKMLNLFLSIHITYFFFGGEKIIIVNCYYKTTCA